MSKKPRKIGQAQLDVLEDFCSEAVGLKEAAQKATSVAKAAEQDYQRKFKSLKVKIATGAYTTGDLVLDWNILLHDSVRKDERYALMAQFDKALQIRGGELLAEVDGFGAPRRVGLLPEPFAGLAIRIGGAHGADEIRFGGDSAVRLVVEMQRVVGSPSIGFEFPVRFDSRPGELVIGNNLICEEELQEWLNKHSDHNGLEVWLDSQELGRPLTPSPKLLELIMKKREDAAVEIHRKIVALVAAQKALAEKQRDFKSWHRGMFAIEDDKVVVSFGDEVGTIRRVWKDLKYLVGYGKRLGMENAPVNREYQEAVSLLESTAQYE